MIAEQATGYPGYDSVIGVDNATISRILRDNGYRDGMVRQDHNTPTYEASQAGPFTHRPNGMGLNYSTVSSAATPTSGAEPVPQHHADIYPCFKASRRVNGT